LSDHQPIVSRALGRATCPPGRNFPATCGVSFYV
jgi:hypothetical protein